MMISPLPTWAITLTTFQEDVKSVSELPLWFLFTVFRHLLPSSHLSYPWLDGLQAIRLEAFLDHFIVSFDFTTLTPPPPLQFTLHWTLSLHPYFLIPVMPNLNTFSLSRLILWDKSVLYCSDLISCLEHGFYVSCTAEKIHAWSHLTCSSPVQRVRRRRASASCCGAAQGKAWGRYTREADTIVKVNEAPSLK